MAFGSRALLRSRGITPLSPSKNPHQLEANAPPVITAAADAALATNNATSTPLSKKLAQTGRETTNAKKVARPVAKTHALSLLEYNARSNPTAKKKLHT
jgi:hypothetical protein